MPVAIPIALAAAGTAASIYGANKNAKAVKEASDANAAAVAATNKLNYQTWLESKGVGTGGQAINVHMPRYMKWNPAAVATRKPNTFAGLSLPTPSV